ncbi:tail fiber assembly chaperone [Pseudomonas phage vB_PsyP_3MF5]|uniref:tail fiber protein n=1 Tax=Pseudomonas phage vB_PsyP_3MF5 TaxID=2749426 RepID=UPI001BDAD0D3|nr:tail fiber protein [Pseudomonas phage vB_PsyP_3MF5]QLI47594.1 tail fiber assembly chaperone [Pseudomonas phage vB_PsyP_3MF5]
MEFPIKLQTGVTLLAVKDPVWANREKTLITCTVTLDGGGFFDKPTEVPFTADPNDVMEHGRQLFEELKGSAGEWVRPDVTVTDLQEELDKIWPDIVLGIADEATVELARNLRKQIKVMSE